MAPPGGLHEDPALRLLFLLLALMAILAMARPGLTAEARALCAPAIARAEREAGLPAGILQAIALAESGRWDKARGEGYAWPWTVTSGAAGRYYASKAEALAEVRRLRAAGRTNIDVGCMQVNLHFHGDAFADVATAMDPAVNAAYAARFLKRLHAEAGDWRRAVAWYHSRTPERGEAYRQRVYARWEGMRPADGAADQGPAVALAEAAQAAGPVGAWSRVLFGWLTSTPAAAPQALFAGPAPTSGPEPSAPPPAPGSVGVGMFYRGVDLATGAP